MMFQHMRGNLLGTVIGAACALLLLNGTVLAQNAQPEPPKPVDLTMKQIAIEAMVIETNKDRTRDLGIDYTYNRNEELNPNNIIEATDVRFPFRPDPVLVPVFTDVGTLGDFALGQVSREPGIGGSLVGMNIGDTGRVAGNIRMLLEQGQAEIRTRPIVVALNGTKANITTADEVPYQDVKFAKGNAALQTAWRKVGVILEVTPRILQPWEKQLVELDIHKLEVSGVSNYVTIRQVTRPIFSTSNTNTKVRLHSAETLVISGMESKREAVNEARIPLLGRIPVLGYLFKTQHKEVKETDILFFITPYILNEGINPILPFDFENSEILTPPNNQEE